jgi:hypothetical protein
VTEPCPEFRDLLSAFADGELPAPDAVHVREHLLACASCREVLAAYAAADSVVAGIGAARTPADWERLAERVETAIARQPLPNAGVLATARAEKRRFRDRFGPRHVSLALGSAGTLLAALLVVLLRPLSEELAPVDTVPPLGDDRTSEGPRRAAAPVEAKSEQDDVAATPESPAPAEPESRGTEQPAPASLDVGSTATATLEDDAAGARKGLVDEPAAPAPERLRALGYVGGGPEPPRGGVVELLHSVDEAEALLAENSDRPRRSEILGTLVRLWADLVEIDPDHHCAAASVAVRNWEALALDAPSTAELDAVRRIRDACRD